MPNAFDAVFVASLSFALIGLGVLGLFVQNRAVALPGAPKPSLKSAIGLLDGRQLRALIIAGSLLGIVTISDAFLYLGLQQRLAFSSGLLPLLYVVTSLIYFVLAVPFGRLADLYGRTKVFVAGYALLIVVYAMLLLPSVGVAELLVCLVLFGAYYAATDGVLMALASPILPIDLRTSGIALLTTATSLARLVASMRSARCGRGRASKRRCWSIWSA